MAKHAFKLGSCDNITVNVLLLLRNPAEIPAGAQCDACVDDEYVNFSGGENPKRATSTRLSSEPGGSITLLAPPSVPYAGPMSPGALSSEIFAALDGKASTGTSSVRGEACANKVEAASVKSADKDDDIMSFLMDDSNF